MRDEARGASTPPPATLEALREELEGMLQLIDARGREANA
jgi:hypothetical protein